MLEGSPGRVWQRQGLRGRVRTRERGGRSEEGDGGRCPQGGPVTRVFRRLRGMLKVDFVVCPARCKEGRSRKGGVCPRCGGAGFLFG